MMPLGKMRWSRSAKTDALACLGKTRWSSEEAAQWAITRLRRDYPDAFDSTVRPFRCPACKRWHLGHE